MKRDYFKDSEVDKYNLDKEYEEIPSIYMHWAEAAGEAKAEQLRTSERLRNLKIENKKKLDEKRAQIDAYIRNNWEAEFDKKPTEAQIVNLINMNPDYITFDKELTEELAKATEEWIQAVRNEEVLVGARAAMGKRAASVEGLAQLFLKDYYPRQPPQMKKESQDKQSEEQKEGLKNSRISRRRRT